METLKERGGPPVLRVGGNSQEKADLVSSLPDGESIIKEDIGPTGVVRTQSAAALNALDSRVDGDAHNFLHG